MAQHRPLFIWYGSWLLLLILLLTTGCDRQENGVVAGAPVVGQYQLVNLGGGEVQRLIRDTAGNELLVDGISLVMRNDGTFVMTVTAVLNNDNLLGYDASGAYTVDGSSVNFEADQPPSPIPAFSGQFDGNDTITTDYPLGPFSYRMTFEK